MSQERPGGIATGAAVAVTAVTGTVSAAAMAVAATVRRTDRNRSLRMAGLFPVNSFMVLLRGACPR
ncbi:hypothetical protein GCM10010504_23460 [Streptomyces griseus]|nr:hypothetical protein GCM10010504_23460 [Streptomyces griseus]